MVGGVSRVSPSRRRPEKVVGCVGFSLYSGRTTVIGARTRGMREEPCSAPPRLFGALNSSSGMISPFGSNCSICRSWGRGLGSGRFGAWLQVDAACPCETLKGRAATRHRGDGCTRRERAAVAPGSPAARKLVIQEPRHGFPLLDPQPATPRGHLPSTGGGGAKRGLGCAPARVSRSAGTLGRRRPGRVASARLPRARSSTWVPAEPARVCV